MIKLALISALLAAALAASALAEAIGNQPPPSPYPLVCSEQLGTIPVAYPCATARPSP